MYEAIQQRIAAYDREILRKLAAMQRKDIGDQPPPAVKNRRKPKPSKNGVKSRCGRCVPDERGGHD